ncbi:MAG TPA: dihydrofolate reductase family protein [Solirubrobacterales bacterium]
MPLTQYYVAASLDGYIAEPDDGLDWLTRYEGSYDGPGAEAGAMAAGGSYDAFYERVGALVSGSATYEWILAHLDEVADTLEAGAAWPYAGKPYWVLSSRELPVPDVEGIDVRIVEASAEEIHPELARAAGNRNIWVVGGGGVASQFAAAGLLDELHLTVVPVVLGAGKPLFARPLPAMQLRAVTPMRSGMVELRYELAR